MTLSHTDRDLASLAANARHDSMLEAVASVSEIGFFVGLLVNGMTVYGRAVSGRDSAEAFDAEVARTVERWKKADPGKDWTSVEAKLARGWTQKFEEDVRQHDELVERNLGKADVDAMSDDDARQTIQDRPAVLTLAEAKVFPPGAEPFDVPLMPCRSRRSPPGGWCPGTRRAEPRTRTRRKRALRGI
jgi:hypothetical protein